MVSRNKSPSLFGFAIFRTYLSFLPHSPGLSHMVVPFVYCKGTLPRSEIHQVEHLPSGGTFSNSSTGMDASFYQRYYGHWDPNYLIHFPGRAKLSSIYFWWQHVYLKYYFPASQRKLRDPGSIPKSGRSPGEGNGTPFQVLLSGKSHGRRSLGGCSPWGCKDSDTTERLHFDFDFRFQFSVLHCSFVIIQI